MLIQSELTNLFSPNIIRQSKRLRPERVDALAVNEASEALLRLKGKSSEQVALVNALEPSTAAALCRWLVDPAFWSMVSGISKH